MKKEELIRLISESERKLHELKAISYEGLSENITELESLFGEFKESGEELLSSSDTLQIGIVGQVKAGKSSFLNSLFFDGEDVLPKASTPMTAGLTILEYSERNTFEVEYFSEKDWDVFVRQDEEYQKREKEIMANNQGAPENIIRNELKNRTSEKVRSAHEMVSTCGNRAKEKIGKKNDVNEFDDIDDLQNVLENYVGSNGEYTSVVKSLYIKMNDERMKGLRIVDTPGVNDPVVSRENRTRTFLNSCHGVFLLSASTDFLGSADVSFLNARIGGSGIGSVVILASKFDSVLQDIGAEREMKEEGRGDLVDTIEMQTKKFKKRLREISNTIDENLRTRLKLDTTAGIGYSIAHKPPRKRDNVEQRVVEQMKRFYPEYFTTEAELKDTFEGLANMTEIRERYLGHLFMDNKERIIAEKVNAFFSNNRKDISENIIRILEEYNNRREQLESTTLEEIKRQRDFQEKLFGELESTFIQIFERFEGNIQREIKELSNRVLFNEIRSVPTETTSDAITYKGMLWGHNTNEMSFEQVSTYQLGNLIRASVEEYGNSWNTEWKKLFDKTRKEMAEKLNEAISKFETELMSSAFNDAYYRGLIDKALDVLRDYKELPIGDIITEYKRQGDDIACQQYEPSGTSELKKVEVLPHLRKQLEFHKSGLIKQFRILADQIKSDVKKEINKSLQDSISVINKMKLSFSDNLKKEGDTYLKKMEEDMEEKTEVLNKLEDIVNKVKELSILYK